MGAYINPPDMTKEKWLSINGGDVLNDAPEWTTLPEGHLPVCLVDNGIFTAAGICYNEEILRQFSRPDGRPKLWLFVEIEKLHTVSPELKSYMTKDKVINYGIGS